jgi:hypothetical protein
MRLANETILIEAETSFPLAQAGDLSAKLISPLGKYSLVLTTPVLNLNKIQAVASFPGGIRTDVLYDLEISVGGLTDVQRHAIKVLSAYKQEFTAIVWCDTHAGYAEEYADIWQDTYLFIEEMVDQANLINPEFVWLLGDITETALESEYQFMYDQCMRLNVPVFVGPGNHDAFDAFEYQRWCQYFNFTFDYGPDYHFVYVDTGINLDALRDQYFNWLADDLDAHASTPVNIVAGHAAPYQCSGSDTTRINKNFEYLNAEFVELLNQHNVITYLHGHDHKDQNKFGTNCSLVPAGTIPTSMRMLQTASGREDAAYRLLHFKNHQLVNETTRKNATTFERNQCDSFRSFPDVNETITRPDVTKPNLLVTVNASAVNDITQVAVSGVNFTLTSRFPEASFDDFTNMTAGFWISSTLNPSVPANMLYTNSTTVSVSAVQRVDNPSEWWVEFKFNIANGQTVNITVQGA